VQISVSFTIHIWLKLSPELSTVALLFGRKETTLENFANLMIEEKQRTLISPVITMISAV